MWDSTFVDLDGMCWGRAEELNVLTESVLHNRRSATLVYGDSGIGKSTLLKHFVRGLRRAPKTFVGFHETTNGDPDPLLKALDSLLQHIRTKEHLTEQRKIACVKAVDALSLSSLRKFLLKIIRVSGKHLGYEFLADAIDAAAEAALDLDLKVEGMPHLGIEEFRSVLKILQKALPDYKFALVIDNLNAAVGCLGSEIPGLSSLDTIASYVSIDFRQSLNIHLFSSWQRDIPNSTLLKSLIGLFGQYGGSSLYLGSIRSETDIRAWFDQAFPWFRNCNPSQQETMLKLASGLPEVIVDWRDSNVAGYDEKLLSEKAADIRERKYWGIKTQLGDSSKLERKLLVALAYMGRPQSIQVVSNAIDESYEDCRSALQRWSSANVLLRFSDEKDERTYGFDHENKRQVVLDERKVLLEHPEAVCRQIYDFCLNTGRDARMPVTESLSTCLELLSHSWLKVPKPERIFLEQLWEMIRTDKKPSGCDSDRWCLVRSVPIILQAHYLAFSLHCDFGERQIVVDAANSWIDSFRADDVAPADTKKIARPLAHFIEHMKKGEVSLYEKFLDKVRILRQRDPRDAGLACLISNAIARGATIIADAQTIKNNVYTLESLKTGFPDDLGIAESLALSHYLATSHYTDDAGLNAGEALASTEKLAQLCEKYPDSVTIRKHCAAAIYYLVGTAKTRPADGIRLVDLIRSLWNKAPENALLARYFAGTLRYSLGYAHGNVALTSRYLADLRVIFGRFAHEPRIVEHVRQANSIIMVVVSHGGLVSCTEVENQLFQATIEFSKIMTQGADAS